MILIIVFALVGNRAEMYLQEEVYIDEAKAFAEEINAIYKRVSKMENGSIVELYREIGRKFLDLTQKFTKKLNKYVDY